MKYTLSTAIALGGLAFAIPMRQGDDSARTGPAFYKTEIVDLKGPACPDLGSTKDFRTRENYIHSTVDGSEIYFLTLAYPHLRLKLADGETELSTWCETTIKFTEVGDFKDYKEKADYRWRMHKNGTEVMAHYDLEEGVNVNWKFTYKFEDDEIVDKISVNGPITASADSQRYDHTQNLSLKQYKLPQCGGGVVKFRTDVTISAEEEGKTGFFRSSFDDRPEPTDEYGTVVGISYDFEKCSGLT